MLRRPLSVALACALAAPAPVAADDYFKDAPSSTAVAVRVPRERTKGQRLTIYGLLGGAALSAGIGVWAHLDSRDASRALEVRDSEPTETWTDDRQDTYDRALRSRTVAVVGYVLVVGFLTGATVYGYATRPGYETLTLEPTAGGAVLGGSWTW